MPNTAVIYCHILMFEKEDTAVINHFIFLKLVPGEKKSKNYTHIGAMGIQGSGHSLQLKQIKPTYLNFLLHK